MMRYLTHPLINPGLHIPASTLPCSILHQPSPAHPCISPQPCTSPNLLLPYVSNFMHCCTFLPVNLPSIIIVPDTFTNFLSSHASTVHYSALHTPSCTTLRYLPPHKQTHPHTHTHFSLTQPFAFLLFNPALYLCISSHPHPSLHIST